MSEAAPFVDPRRVVLFSGHRVDPAGRMPPRFPDDKADHAGALIDRALRDLDIGPGDLALTQGSSGGDLLFAEAAARRGAHLRLMQPAPEPRFIEESVRTSANGDAWVRRYLVARAAAGAATGTARGIGRVAGRSLRALQPLAARHRTRLGAGADALRLPVGRQPERAARRHRADGRGCPSPRRADHMAGRA
jgi:hypothetical protein